LGHPTCSVALAPPMPDNRPGLPRDCTLLLQRYEPPQCYRANPDLSQRDCTRFYRFPGGRFGDRHISPPTRGSQAASTSRVISGTRAPGRIATQLGWCSPRPGKGVRLGAAGARWRQRCVVSCSQASGKSS
jgi:hypothetical protein